MHQDGETPHRLANKFHHDIVDLTANGVYELMQAITISKITRVPHKRVKVLLLRTIQERHIKIEQLESGIIHKLH